jgi:5-methylcytosine-specific restriction protein A
MPSLPPRYRPPHLGPRKQAEAKRQRELQERRGPRLEDKAWWQKARRRFLAQAENALCVCCKANGITKAAELVDHVIPHGNVDSDLFRDPANWQALCRWCHEHIKKPIELAYHQGKVAAAELRLDRQFHEHFG